MTLDDKIEVFIEAYKGWKINPAKEMIEKGSADWDFAILDVVMSYFEMIAKHRDGNTTIADSAKYFKMGLEQVFPELREWKSDHRNTLLDWFYVKVRCGLYHAAGPGSDIGVGRELEVSFKLFALDLKADDGKIERRYRILINPVKLVAAVEKDFDEYAAELRDRSNTPLRTNFEKKFDFDRRISPATPIPDEAPSNIQHPSSVN